MACESAWALAPSVPLRRWNPNPDGTLTLLQWFCLSRGPTLLTYEVGALRERAGSWRYRRTLGSFVPPNRFGRSHSVYWIREWPPVPSAPPFKVEVSVVRASGAWQGAAATSCSCQKMEVSFVLSLSSSSIWALPMKTALLVTAPPSDMLKGFGHGLWVHLVRPGDRVLSRF